MHKLMIAAATAVMVGSAFAENKAQVYDFSASVKTTTCKETKVSSALEKYFDHGGQFASWNAGAYSKGDEIGLRKQMTVKIAGVIWGCDCPTIAIPDWRPTKLGGKYFGGYLFWNQSTEELYNPDNLVTTFDWYVLNRIDAMTKAEGAFHFTCLQVGQSIHLLGAGFGSVKGTGCDTYIASMSGSLAGFGAGIDGTFGCVFCDDQGCVVGPICDTCVEFDTTDYTVGSGSWSLKYNKSASKKLSKYGYLSKSYSFKKAGITQYFLQALEKAYADDPTLLDLAGADDLQADDDDDYESTSNYRTLIAGWDKYGRTWKHLNTIVDIDTDELDEETTIWDLLEDAEILRGRNTGLVDAAMDEEFLKIPEKLEAKTPDWVIEGTDADLDFAEIIGVADLS